MQNSREAQFFKLAERFRAAEDPKQVKRLGGKLGRLVFGNRVGVKQIPRELKRARNDKIQGL